MSFARPRVLPAVCWSVLLLVGLLAVPGGARAAAVGEIDSTFNSGQVLQYNLATSRPDEGYATHVQPDGKILVAGRINDGTKDVFAVARFLAEGSIDTTFGSGGLFSMAFGSGNGDSAAMDITMHGARILVAGYGSWGSGSDMVVAQLTSSGALDAGNFGSSGYVTVNFAGGDVANSITTDALGRAVVGGTDGSDFAIVRLTTAGGLDSAFNSTGKLTWNVFGATGGFDRIADVAVDASYRIYAAGTGAQSGTSRMVIARFSANGVLDTTGFGGSNTGYWTGSIGNLGDEINGIVVDPAGRVVAVGASHNSSTQASDMQIIRLTSAGVGDTGWGTSGVLTKTFGADTSEIGNDVAIDPDGRIVVVGTVDTTTGPERVAVLRYLAGGSPDNAWSSDGEVLTSNLSAAEPAYGHDLALAGRDVVVSGAAMQSGDLRTLLVRYYGGDAPPVTGSTMLDLSSCTGTSALSFGNLGPSASALTSADCPISFGHSTSSSMLRVLQSDASGTAMFGPGPIADYAPGAWGALGQSLFGACLRDIQNGSTSGSTWQLASLGSCGAADTVPWNPIPATSTKVAESLVPGQLVTVKLRFGVRTSAFQVPGSYRARMTFEVVNPNG